MVITVVVISLIFSLMDKVKIGGWMDGWMYVGDWFRSQDNGERDIWIEVVPIWVSVGRPDTPPSLHLKPSAFDPRE
ncbi:hypothetical protein EJD97_014633, partial [Solanum chilense]